jgi:hypothetical protein
LFCRQFPATRTAKGLQAGRALLRLWLLHPVLWSSGVWQLVKAAPCIPQRHACLLSTPPPAKGLRPPRESAWRPPRACATWLPSRASPSLATQWEAMCGSVGTDANANRALPLLAATRPAAATPHGAFTGGVPPEVRPVRLCCCPASPAAKRRGLSKVMQAGASLLRVRGDWQHPSRLTLPAVSLVPLELTLSLDRRPANCPTPPEAVSDLTRRCSLPSGCEG